MDTIIGILEYWGQFDEEKTNIENNSIRRVTCCLACNHDNNSSVLCQRGKFHPIIRLPITPLVVVADTSLANFYSDWWTFFLSMFLFLASHRSLWLWHQENKQIRPERRKSSSNWKVPFPNLFHVIWLVLFWLKVFLTFHTSWSNKKDSNLLKCELQQQQVSRSKNSKFKVFETWVILA